MAQPRSSEAGIFCRASCFQHHIWMHPMPTVRRVSGSLPGQCPIALVAVIRLPPKPWPWVGSTAQGCPRWGGGILALPTPSADSLIGQHEREPHRWFPLAVTETTCCTSLTSPPTAGKTCSDHWPGTFGLGLSQLWAGRQAGALFPEGLYL